MISFEFFAQKADVPFVPRALWPEFPLENTIDKMMKPERHGTWIRYGLFPMILYVHYGDDEPKLLPKRWLPRFYIWDRVICKGKQKGWLQVGIKPRHIVAVSYFDDEKSYFGRWSDTHRWKRNRWQRERDLYSVEEVSLDVFLSAYRKSSTYTHIPSSIMPEFFRVMRKRVESSLITYAIFVKDKKTGDILAGGLFEFSMMTKNTHYLCGFIQSHKDKRPVMVGLFDEWVRKGMTLSMKWYNYGIYVHPGTDKGKEGFSELKRGLGVALVEMPPSLIQLRW